MVRKMALIRGNGGLDIRFCVRDPEKHILGRNRMFWRILRQNPSTALGFSELQEPPPLPPKKTNTFLVRKVTNAQKRNAWVDRDKLLHGCRGPRRNHLCRFVLRSLTGFGPGGGSNFGFLHWLAKSPLLPCECVIWTKFGTVHYTITTLSTRRNGQIHINWKSKMAAAAIFNFGKNVNNSGLDKDILHQIIWQNASRPCRDNHITKSRNRKIIRVTSSNEGLKHMCVDLSFYNRYLNQIW